MNNEEYLKTGSSPQERAEAFARQSYNGLTPFQKRHPEVVGKPVPLSDWWVRANSTTPAEESKSTDQNK